MNFNNLFNNKKSFNYLLKNGLIVDIEKKKKKKIYILKIKLFPRLVKI